MGCGNKIFSANVSTELSCELAASSSQNSLPRRQFCFIAASSPNSLPGSSFMEVLEENFERSLYGYMDATPTQKETRNSLFASRWVELCLPFVSVSIGQEHSQSGICRYTHAVDVKMSPLDGW